MRGELLQVEPFQDDGAIGVGEDGVEGDCVGFFQLGVEADLRVMENRYGDDELLFFEVSEDAAVGVLSEVVGDDRFNILILLHLG